MSAVATAIDNAVSVAPWSDPDPLRDKITAEPYPLDALPDLVRDAVIEVQGYVQSPIAMVATSALSAIATAVQGHFDVARDTSLIGPTSINTMTLGDSGERKTSGDGYFNRPALQYESEQRLAAIPVLRDYKAAKRAHDARLAGLSDAIRKLAREGKPTEGKTAELQRLENDAPKRPRVPRLQLTDATPEGLTHTLMSEWPTGTVATDEGGLIFGGQAMGRDSIMRNFSTLNVLWDGKPISINRRTSESYTVEGVRLSVSIQVQRTTLAIFLEKNADLARGSGFLARFLFADPQTTQGMRPYRKPPEDWPLLTRYNDRLRTVLRWPVELDERGALTPALLSLDADAHSVWAAWHDAVERDLAPGGELAEVRDVASKAADNVARVAALFQVMIDTDRPTAVGQDAVRRAGQVVAWHLNEAHRFLGELSISDDELRAAKLDAWLASECAQTGEIETTRRQAQRSGPASTRTAEHLDDALAMLESRGRIRLAQDDRSAIRVQVHPKLIDAARSKGVGN